MVYPLLAPRLPQRQRRMPHVCRGSDAQHEPKGCIYALKIIIPEPAQTTPEALFADGQHLLALDE
jgi:hypothetical protein